ncbi:MAG: polysaccharide lyase 6 family protein [Bacteroidales bacterium]
MKRLFLYFFLLSLFPVHLMAGNQKISLTELNKVIKNALPGDTITLISGVYENVELEVKANGNQSKPIVIMADMPSEVKITGKSSLKIAGEWIVVQGLWFNKCTPADGGSVIEFRLGSDAANNCRVTDCVIQSCNPESRDISYSYVLLYGRNNRFDHNSLLDKLNLGVTLIVMLNQERDQQNFHRIDHNYFGHKPVFGSNGAETIRIGTATQALKSSNTIVEHNYFDRCNGEVEVISVKSSDNIIRSNYFNESQGVLALRHGDRNIAHNNYFNGNGVRNTGGIRVINAGHEVYGNTFVNLKGERFFSALAVMNAVPNSLPNRYCLVKDVDINNNFFIDCDHITFGVGSDQERTLPPEDVRFYENIIINSEIDSPYEAKSSVNGVIFTNNSVKLSGKEKLTKGFKVDGNLNSEKFKSQIPVLRSECGQSWSLPVKEKTSKTGKLIYVESGADKLLEAIKGASEGDIIELTDSGDYSVSSDIFIDFPLTIRASKDLKERPQIRYNGSKQGNIITIRDGGELTVSGLSFNGMSEPGKATPSAGISTKNGMIKPYLLTIDNCEFFDFPEGTTTPVRGLKNTFSEKIVIKNSLFRAVSADAINYAGERDDQGKYNVEELIIENCSFNRILGIGVNVYRGGSDESTAGPIVKISNCTFEDVCNKERGSVLRLIGAQVLDVKNCNFSNSGRGGVSIRLDETTFERVKIRNCNFWNSGRVLTMTGKVVEGKMYNVKPQYLDMRSFDYRSLENSLLNKKNIGVR